jgi:Fic family protein
LPSRESKNQGHRPGYLSSKAHILPKRPSTCGWRIVIEWFARTRRDGQQSLSALTRAAIAHLYFESIHPFEDGNGRIGRAIAEKSLAESLGQPTLITLAATILLRRKSYYEAL